MKIAFVNQPVDTILPPFQTSVGACTYGAASRLAKHCSVLVYGLEEQQRRCTPGAAAGDVVFRFFPSTAWDRLLFNSRCRVSKLGIPLAPNSSSNWQFPAFGRQVAADLQREQCDVIHLQHCSQYAPLIRQYNPRAKLVLHVHTEWFSQNVTSHLYPRLAAVDLVTGVSDYVAAKVRAACPGIAGRCETTYNGIDPREFQREPDCTARSHRTERRIMYAGAVSPHKGIHVLLDAFELLLKRFPNVRLDIIGVHATYPTNENFDAQDRAALESVARYHRAYPVDRMKARLGLAPSDAGTYLSHLRAKLSRQAASKVRFLGMIPRPDLLENYYSADVFVFPSIWNEGFGIPPIEAMAAGMPVVATRAGALPETIVDGETGFLVEKNEPAELARALTTLLENDDLRERMGWAGRRRALQHFTWDRIAETMYLRYLRLCKSSECRTLQASISRNKTGQTSY